MNKKQEKYYLMKFENTYESLYFTGFKRPDGVIATANYWVFMPTVFCENRNLDVIKESLSTALGFSPPNPYSHFVKSILSDFQQGHEISTDFILISETGNEVKKMNSIDGLRFLNHEGGCGGTRQDASSLSNLLASYADHPNVAGVSVLSLGCQHLQVHHLKEDLQKRNPFFNKKLLVFEQQQSLSEEVFIAHCMRDSFAEMTALALNKKERFPIQDLKLAVVEPSSSYSGQLLKKTSAKLQSVLQSLEIQYTVVQQRESLISDITLEVASGVQMVLDLSGFEHGVGNPLCPVIRISEKGFHTKENEEKYDLLLDGNDALTMQDHWPLMILQYCCNVLNGEVSSNSMSKNWWDFKPQKAGVSL